MSGGGVRRVGRAARRGERGLSESLQWAVLFPMLLLAILGTVQAGILMHGHNTATSAAQTAADLASAYPGSIAEATAAARRVAAAGGLVDVDVVIRRGPVRTDVEVVATIPVFFDIGQSQVSEHASAATERVS